MVKEKVSKGSGRSRLAGLEVGPPTLIVAVLQQTCSQLFNPRSQPVITQHTTGSGATGDRNGYNLRTIFSTAHQFGTCGFNNECQLLRMNTVAVSAVE
ncbi:hypothetical protein M407DRAFT_22861 [Tulasnella calospora MUT 4182]|uniref:Uncharacterized protein n=1 Tax=Tulasnella calospora MUT 4182 TaxID=1051891 RepID=A0A0C3L2K0_9AGAM|nr:hypothetical protein M407DRAFT_22861 [Tulasnella calospora MUT 4182]